MVDPNDDIVKYLRGELTPAEMHALEEKALRDPFLAEALEGAALVNSDSFKSDLESLQQSITARTKVKAGKVVSFWVWPARIAAGLLLLMLCAIFVVNLTSRDSKEDLALNKQSAPAGETNDEQKGPGVLDTVQKENNGFLSQAEPAKDITTKAPQAETKAAEIPATPPVAEKELPSSKGEARADRAETTDDLVVEEESIQTTPQPAESKKAEDSRLSFRKKDKSGEAAAGASAERSARDEPSNQRILQGQVVATDGSALPGVNVMIKGTNVGTVTDSEGNYQISVGPESTSLVFSFIGYVSSELPAGQTAPTIVHLSEDVTSLSEVVVVGYQRPTDDTPESTYEMAAPSGGRRAYKQYLEKNLKYPEVALEMKVQGKVTVQFTVEPTGQLSDFKVVKGIGSGCDEEVIRLIKQGPQWTPSMKNNAPQKDMIKVRMKFELPK